MSSTILFSPPVWFCILVAGLNQAAAEAQVVPSSAWSDATSVSGTVYIGDKEQSSSFESQGDGTRYQNGFFIDTESDGHVHLWGKDGRLIGYFVARLPWLGSQFVHDSVALKDGTVVLSFIYMAGPPDQRRQFFLAHFNTNGDLLETLDLGLWRALKVCVADDQSFWTLSEKEEFGVEKYSPEEGVLRNYKFGSGLVRAGVPRSNFAEGYAGGDGRAHVALDCAGKKIHTLTATRQWIEYTPGADYTITPVDELSHATFGEFWWLAGFAYLDQGHAYALIHSVPGDPFRKMFAELLPTEDHARLHWVEVPSEAITPATKHAAKVDTPSAHATNPPVTLTDLFGADHQDGEYLVYRLSDEQDVRWSEPRFVESELPSVQH